MNRRLFIIPIPPSNFGRASKFSVIRPTCIRRHRKTTLKCFAHRELSGMMVGMTLWQTATPAPRSRVWYAGLVILVIVCGLLSRHYRVFLPWWMAENTGDVLWALCVYLVWGWLRPAAPIMHVTVSALLFAYAIECSQLYQAPWINAVRHTPLGLILGYGFVWSDLLCYTIGISLGMLGEWILLMHTRRSRVADRPVR